MSFPVLPHEFSTVLFSPRFLAVPPIVAVVTMLLAVIFLGVSAASLLAGWFQAGLLESISRVK
jgi:hypothetical protein